jgi:Tat protein secretion system quality control protein TatD with DNase activity
MEDDQRTMAELAKNAVDVLSAVNVSGIVHSFSRDIARLRVLLEHEPNFGTTMVNTHPICVLYSTVIADLTHSDDTGAFSSYRWAQDQIKVG